MLMEAVTERIKIRFDWAELFFIKTEVDVSWNPINA